MKSSYRGLSSCKYKFPPKCNFFHHVYRGEVHMNGHTHQARDIHTQGHTHGGTSTRRDITTRRDHTSGGNAHEWTFTRREKHGRPYIEEHTQRGHIL